MAVGKVSDADFEAEVLNATGPVVDESPKTASKYGVMSIPTLMIFKGGEMASRQVGAAPKQKLQQWITAAV